MTIQCLRPARVNPVLRHPQELRQSLDGDWRFRLDPQDCGVREGWFHSLAHLPERIRVPGCWQGQGFGGDGKDRLWDFNLEARVFRATYKGTGWYARTFHVPQQWQGRQLWLNFGGVHPSAEVWLNGTRLGENALPFVPFGFNVTDLVRDDGQNLLVVRVHEQNREFGFSFSWQGNWSGLYRGVDLVATGPAWFTRVAVLPDVDAQALRLQLATDATHHKPGRHTVTVSVALVEDGSNSQYMNRGSAPGTPLGRGAPSPDPSRPSSRHRPQSRSLTRSSSGVPPEPPRGAKSKAAAPQATSFAPGSLEGERTCEPLSAEFALTGDSSEFTLPVPNPRLWTPDSPLLYRVDLVLKENGTVCEVRSERVGFVKLEAHGQQFCIGGEPYYLRGSGDFISCPETGCPDTDRDRWRRKLKALRDYGYNYVRCQSYVYGPEYYDAADEVGILIQSEMGMLGAWGGTSPWHVYQWPKPTPDNYPTLKQQWDLVVERDACHPSANLYCMSNEYYANTDFPRVAWDCYHATKARKPSAFVIWTDGGYNKDLPGDFINHSVGAFKPEDLKALDKPLIQHEYQWWSSFPDIRQRAKYSGAVRAYAAEIAAETAARRGQAHLLETYAHNSQRLQFIEAKAKMEAMRRDNPTLAGINHFNAMDANPSPQGIIDEFYERKLASAATWLQTNGDTVVLSSLGFDNRCWQAGQTVKVQFSISDFAHPPFQKPRLEWRLVVHDVAGASLLPSRGGRSIPAPGQDVAAGVLTPQAVPFTTAPAGEIELAVPYLEPPGHRRHGCYRARPRGTKGGGGGGTAERPDVSPLAATLDVRLVDGASTREIRNAWPLWIFPETALPAGVCLCGDAKWSWLRHWRDRLSLFKWDGHAAGRPAVGTARAPASAVAGPLTAKGRSHVVLTERLNTELLAFMQRGGHVILAAGEGLVRPHGPNFGYVKYFFTPPANYSPYEDGQNGTVVATHPMLGALPHEGFADWQFFRVMDNAPPLDLEPLGLADGDPVIRVIHRYPTLHPLGYLVERRVGAGGLILCALELNPEWVEAHWLLQQLCAYAASAAFDSAPELSPEAQARLLAAG